MKTAELGPRWPDPSDHQTTEIRARGLRLARLVRLFITATSCLGPADVRCHSPSLRCEVAGRPELLTMEVAGWAADDFSSCTPVSPPVAVRPPPSPPQTGGKVWIWSLPALSPPDVAPPPGALASAPGLRGLIHQAATDAGLSPALVHAVIQQESGYNPRARSPKGALGLMQVLPSTARDYGVFEAERLLDEQVNLSVGTRHLARLLRSFEGRVDLALAAYNAGEGHVARHGGRVPPFSETRQYVERVMSRLGL